ncbi:NAD-dependent succinate-semialdehyde dehydrogenase [uncultured Agrococcus sp.]|uniref:NAD-dependent succinate-semialdehyde dehydrogenase n=1 Tax=uncultured Agrococcus sp. TaxID=382258 RepID=UPI0025CF1882|nr:NAD-dependent succinate-semialdehyde dehydrogenase [uncultured Agrococcus sp.]
MTNAAKERELLESVPGKLFIDGEWVDGEDGTIDVTDPATGERIHTIANGSVADGVRALDAACAVQDDWARTSARERSDILRRAYDLVMERAEDFALLMTLEMGKPLSEARGEVKYGAEFLRWFSEEAVRVYGRYHDNPENTGRMLVSYRPVGPCYLITPWNFPLAMATRKIGPALAAGCTMVVKPATLTPLTTLAFVRVLEEAGLPKGVVNVITTRSTGALTDAIMEDDRLRKVSFTGSTPVGINLMKKASEKVLRTSMELGGNAPFVVFEDADLDKAVDGALAAKFRNIGEACTAANRFIVHESVADEFVQRVTERVNELKIGRGTEEGVTIGPLVEDKAVVNMERLVGAAVDSGARLTTGGKKIDGPGSFFQPTVLDGVSDDMEISLEEIFGPVLAVQRFSTEEEAIARANATEYGLMSYVYTEDVARQHRLVDLIDTGMMGINIGVLANAAAPFGGVKQSGIGREGGAEGILEYLSMKYSLMPNPHA